MITANTTALVHHDDPGFATPRSWAFALAAVALLGLALLGLLGAEFGAGVQASADAVRGGAVSALGGLDAIVAGIRWVR